MINAIKDKVVVQLLTREKTKSGLIIPDSVQEPQAFCKVITVGSDVQYITEDDIIVCHMRAGMDVLIDKDLIKVLKEDEIYGVLTDEDTLKPLKTYDITKKHEMNKPKLIKRI